MEESIKDAGKQKLQYDTNSQLKLNLPIIAINLFQLSQILSLMLFSLIFKYCCSNNNNSWFGVGSSYSGVYSQNTTDNIPPSSDVYYLLNFNNILTSYGNNYCDVLIS